MPSDNILLKIWNPKNPHDEVAISFIDKNKLQNETSKDRLKQMFILDENGCASKEIATVIQLSLASAMGGYLIGGVARSRVSYINFMENNQATQFINHLDAKRKLSREMYLAFTKGGFSLGWRVGLFTFIFSSILTSVATYRGKDAILEYFIAGGVTGGLFKTNMGLKGMVTGSVFGAALGTIAGGLSALTLKLGGVSMEDIRNFSKLMHDARENAKLEAQKKYMAKEFDMAQKTAKENSRAEQEFLDMKVQEESAKS
ncbi:RPII140-upstream gene protein [Venturia canescens]|uniref:RPII140-upstream gene protein n=1 Tax=Venturia canescens TaxID=32260 RepID=UPI001C9D23B8|nr:RPII140-upstream gene protein [Venturia canescens]